MKNLSISPLLRTLMCIAIVASGYSIQAQSATPSSELKKSFQRHFNETEKVSWKKTGPLFYATFLRNQDYCIAFFDRQGNVITSGRKIKYNMLPLSVQRNFKATSEALEKKYGTLAIGSIFEMIEEGIIKYHIPLKNNRQEIALSAGSSGLVLIEKRLGGVDEISFMKDLFAKEF